MNSNFNQSAIELRNKFLLATEQSFVANKQNWVTAYKERFQAVCSDVVKAQNAMIIPPISYLEFTMLISNFINRRYVAEVWVYSDDWYLGKSQRVVGEYDVSFLFTYFDELWGALLALRKSYGGMVSSQEIAAFMIQALPDFYSYLFCLSRRAIIDCVGNKPFTDIATNDVFEIRVGDYMAKTEPIYTHNKNKNADELAGWFSERLECDYIFEDCSELDFSKRDFTNTALRYVQFREAILNHAILKSSSLIGASFYKARMESCDLRGSVIHEADFSYANMKCANLSGVCGKAGLPNKNIWRRVGFLPVSFRSADLSGATFKQANLTGADFSGAKLSDTDFSGALLDRAIFSDVDLPLTEVQKSKIIISDSGVGDK